MLSAADTLALIAPCWQAGGARASAGERQEEYADLTSLLLAGASAPQDSSVVALAECVARACLGQDHLWHDLGLPSRAHLSDLLATHFPGLASRNTEHMRWKKFFYQQLCAQEGIRACRAPSCGVCAHHGDCFSSEDIPLAQLATHKLAA